MSMGYIVSIILNIIFGILIFLRIYFKDPIHKWLFRTLELGADKKGGEGVILRKLRTLLFDYSGAFSMFAIYTIGYFNGAGKFVDSHLEDLKEKYDLVTKELIDIKPGLDKAIRDKLDLLMLEVCKITIAATEKGKYTNGIKSMGQDEFIWTIVNTQQQCALFIGHVEDIINN